MPSQFSADNLWNKMHKNSTEWNDDKVITIQQKLIHKTEFPQYECLYDSLALAHQHWHCTDEHKLGDKGDVELLACSLGWDQLKLSYKSYKTRKIAAVIANNSKIIAKNVKIIQSKWKWNNFVDIIGNDSILSKWLQRSMTEKERKTALKDTSCCSPCALVLCFIHPAMTFTWS